MTAQTVEQTLIKHLSEAHALEKQALQLLDKGADMVGDEEIARIFRAHRLQTQEHERYVAERLSAHGESPSKLKDAAMQVGALGIGAAAKAMPDTPVTLAKTAFAFENLEIATYELIERLARRAGDVETVQVAQRIREQEEAAAQLVAGIFDRTLELALGEEPRSPLPPLTPLGKPSDRHVDPSEHEGPQWYKEVSPDEPIGMPSDITESAPAEEKSMQPPQPGHPAGSTRPA